MGGALSGWRWSKKPVVEGCQTIDTVDLKRLKLLVPGTGPWTSSLHWYRGKSKDPSSSVGSP